MQTKRFTTAVLLIVCMACVALACVGCGIQNQPENGRETKITRLYGKTVSALLEAKETEAEAADVWAIVALTGNSLARLRLRVSRLRLRKRSDQ